MNCIYLSLGSNQGNRIGFLQNAVEAIKRYIGKTGLCSSYYETDPWGYISDKRFINQAISVYSTLSPVQILEKIFVIESNLGRKRDHGFQPYSNRTIDIDILFYANEIYHSGNLEIPHKYLHERRFVLEPLCEIAPDLIHPLLNTSVKELLQQCRDGLNVIKYDFDKLYALDKI